MKKVFLAICFLCSSFSFLGAYYNVTVLPIGSHQPCGFNSRGEVVFVGDNDKDMPIEEYKYYLLLYQKSFEIGDESDRPYVRSEDIESHPFIWDKDNGQRYLEDLIDPSLDIRLKSPIFINDNGDILVRGFDLTSWISRTHWRGEGRRTEYYNVREYEVRWYLLTPVDGV